MSDEVDFEPSAIGGQKGRMATDRQFTARTTPSAQLIGLGLWGLVVLFAIAFLWRGPVRGWTGESRDGAMLYTASKAWVLGSNPYDGSDCVGILRKSGGGALVVEADPQQFASLYPPSLFPVLAPLAMLSWPAAKLVAVGVNLSVPLGVICLLWRLMGLREMWWRQTIAILVLAWAPLHTNAALGQLAGLILLLILLGMIIRPAWAAGLCIGLAVAMKPQIGLPFLVYFFWCKRYGTAAWGGAVSIVIACLAVARLRVTSPSWWQDLGHNLAVMTDPVGGNGSPSPSNPLVYQMIDSAPLFFRFIESALLVTMVVYGLALLSAVLAIFFARRYKKPDIQLLMIAGFAIVPLIPVYHRFYDATILLFVAAWALARIRVGLGDLWAVATLIVLLPFLVPGSAMLSVLETKGYVPDWIVESGWWGAFALQHQSWLVLLLLLVLLGALAAGCFRDRGEAGGRLVKHA